MNVHPVMIFDQQHWINIHPSAAYNLAVSYCLAINSQISHLDHTYLSTLVTAVKASGYELQGLADQHQHAEVRWQCAEHNCNK